ncbi:MAG: tetratricopeptide repeat protein [Planctomycetota bacterium]
MPSTSYSKRTRILALVGLALVAIAAYAPSLAGGFVWDDQALIVDNAGIRSWNHVGEILTRDFFHLNDDPIPYGYYRPVVSLSYLLEYQLWGLAPLGYHLTNVLLHAVSTVLVALVLRRLRMGDGACLAAALLFALHPIHTENVAWIAGRTDLFAFALTATAFLAHAAAVDREEGAARLLVVSTLAFALGLLAKEMSVVLLPWLALCLRFLHGRSWKRIALELAPYLLVFASYCALRFWILDIDVPGAARSDQLRLALWSAAPTVLRYLGWMLAPIGLNAYVQNPYVTAPTDPRLLVSLAVLAVLGIVLWRKLRKPEERLVLAMLATSFLPILNLVRVAGPADMGNAMSERFLYFPSFPFLALVVLLAARLLGERKPSSAVRAAMVGSLIVAAGWSTVQTVRRTLDWRDERTFVTKTLAQSPGAPLLWNLMALARLKSLVPAAPSNPEETWRVAGKDDTELREVAEALRTAVRLNPDYLGAQHNLGATLYRLGDLEGAVQAFREAIRIKPTYVKGHLNLGAALQDAGDTDGAIAEYRAVIAIFEGGRPRSGSASQVDLSGAHYNLGVALLGKGDPEGAGLAFREALEIRPDLIGPLVNEARFRAEGGDLASAASAMKEVLTVQPKQVPFRSQYARILAGMGRIAEAEAVIQAGMEQATVQERETLARALTSLKNAPGGAK